MRRVLLFAATTGYQIRAFGEAAAASDVRLVFASDRCDQLDDPWWDGAIPVRWHLVNEAVAAVTAAFGDSPPAGILAVGDRPAVMAAHAAEAFGLPGHPPVAAERTRNKLQTRRALRAAGLPTPSFQAIDVDGDHAALGRLLPYPVVVKPLALSGSRGVMRADDEAAFEAVVWRLRRLLQSPDVRAERDGAHDQALIETFIPGRELAVEGVMTAGMLTTFAIFDKPDPLDGPFFEETIYLTPTRETDADRQSIVEQVEDAARAIGLRHGPVHAECRVNATGVYVLEVAARPIGGLCSRAVKLAGPGGRLVSLEEVLLRHALGEDISRYRPRAGASGVMMIPIPARGVFKGVAGVEEALREPGVDEIHISAKRDARLIPLPEGHSYLGFIFASGERPEDVDAALRAAHRRLRFDVQKEVTVVTPAGEAATWSAAARNPEAVPHSRRRRNLPADGR